MLGAIDVLLLDYRQVCRFMAESCYISERGMYKRPGLVRVQKRGTLLCDTRLSVGEMKCFGACLWDGGEGRCAAFVVRACRQVRVLL